jgi:threonine/homoserine/homoserine lactone efflux protein
MIELPAYFAFVLAATLIIATPGPSVLFVIARSINLGAKGGILSVCGVALGALCHAAAVALGLATVLQASPLAFEIIKYLGCLYLIYLGVRTMLAPPASREELPGSFSRRRVLLQGLLVELLNPKTALFFLAFLPQFASPERGAVATQLLVLGLTFVVLGVISDGIYAALAGKLAGVLKRSTLFRRTEKYLTGTVYCGLGIVGLVPRAMVRWVRNA